MQSTLPNVVVLLAAYNGIKWIDQQLDSILAQQDINVTIYISIDPSSDGTEKRCTEYSTKHPNVIILPPAGAFGGAARNFYRLIKDVDFSSFDYVAFSDQDDIWHNQKIARAHSSLKTEAFSAYSSNVIAFWPDGRRLVVDKAQRQAKWDYLFEAAGPGCTYVLKRELADAFKRSLIANWDQAQNVSLHDWYCYAFARRHDYKWFIDPFPGMDYRQHAHNEIGVNAGVASARTRLKKIMKGWWSSQVLLINKLTETETSSLKYTKKHSRFFFIKLICHAYECRRRPRDKLLFAAVCIMAALTVPSTATDEVSIKEIPPERNP
ncbi:lipopolysaccharide biosynthesis protein [Pseudomonas amygdali pv. mori str. 301020]|uniref:Lipopolysaccharide biosynthesis protein n=1 Tax=Pseudomonas amygdali pv. mori str. 301020 TaxID=629261 RepID=A0A656G4A4_PSEA0|nr:lipopolysaccharide biosynthesis protein [Pseudomonas amygdali pv. mori str. 301020]